MRNRTVKIPELPESIKNKFLSKIAYTANPNLCWEWLGSIKGNYYGKISFT